VYNTYISTDGGRASIDAAVAEVKRIDRELDTLLNLILKGGVPDRINEKMVALEGRKKSLETFLSDAEEPPPLLHPNMAHHYRVQVAELHAALQEDSEAKRMAAADIIRSLVKEIVLTPSENDLRIDVRGDLAGILAVSLKTKTPATRAGESQVMVVAGARFELTMTTFRL
jgi:site-specific DNA recombinase